MKNIKKRAFIVFIIMGISIAFLFIINYKNKEIKELNEQILKYRNSYSAIYHKLTSLNLYEFNKKIDNNEEFFVYIGRPSCMDCNKFEEFFIDLIDTYSLNKKIYYLNISELSDDENLVKQFINDNEISGIPTLIKYNNGNIENKIEWTKENGFSKEYVEEWMNRNKLYDN